VGKLLNKFWCLLFLLVPILGVATFIASPYYDHWLPEDVSTHGRTIDHLFYFILWLTGAVFVATEVAMFIFMWRYDGAAHRRPVKFMHGSHTLEVVWTILPAATLLFIAIYQMNAWADTKMRRPDLGPDGLRGTADDMAPTVEVTARQFEWRLRYPGQDGVIGTKDDLHTVNELVLPPNEEILVMLKSEDVLHSFFLPHLRVKQDAVPGMKIPVWFQSTRPSSEYDLVCAELCGWGHYKMKGRVIFTKNRREYDDWLRNMQTQQEATKPEQPTEQAEGDE
jgi:cytochrome c oxidase subunit 2